jgi:ribosomal protein S18 acetylase RimI-like enzyme
MRTPAQKPPIDRLEIREVELEDLPAIFALGERLFTADRHSTLYRTWDEYELVDLFSSDGETCLVATLDERVVGFALGTLIEKRRSAWTYGYLVWLGVDPATGRRGVGRRLLDRLKALFIEQGARMMLVDTAASNAQAIGFFRGAGFGQEQKHVYLSKNLTTDPEYIRRKQGERPRRRAPVLRGPGVAAAPPASATVTGAPSEILPGEPDGLP